MGIITKNFLNKKTTKMKDKLTIVAIMLIFFSCSKTDDFQSVSDVSEIKIPKPPRPIPQGDTTVTWSTNAEGQKVKHVKYNHFRVSINEIYDGTKHITFLKKEKDANVGDTISKSKLADGFRIGYVKPDSSLDKDTIIEWKTVTMLIKKMVAEDGYKRVIDKTTKDKFGNYGRSHHVNYITIVDDNTKSRTGTAKGRDNTQGDILVWQSEVTEPIITHKGWSYPASGRIRYELDNDGDKSVQILDYGNGANDPFAKLYINGVPYDIVLPSELPGENEAAYGD